MTKTEVMKALEGFGNPSTLKIFRKHGLYGAAFGVKVADLKVLQKKIKKDHQLSLDLYASGNGDAMYLAGLIADEGKISKKDLKIWAKKSEWQMVSEYTVPWIASESNHGLELALEWIDSKEEKISSCVWSTLASLVSIKNDEYLDLPLHKNLLKRVEKEIHNSPNRTRYAMNGFVIAVGSYIESLNENAMKTAEAIGKVEVLTGETACKVPFAPDYIQKVVDKGRLGKKRKKARC